MARRAAALGGFGTLALALSTSPAAAQGCTGPACRPSPEATVVVAEAPVSSATASEGLLRDADEAGGATAAVGGSLIVVTATLTAIARRRLAVARPTQLPTPVVGAAATATAGAASDRTAPQWDPVLIERRAAGFLREPAQRR